MKIKLKKKLAHRSLSEIGLELIIYIKCFDLIRISGVNILSLSLSFHEFNEECHRKITFVT